MGNTSGNNPYMSIVFITSYSIYYLEELKTNITGIKILSQDTNLTRQHNITLRTSSIN